MCRDCIKKREIIEMMEKLNINNSIVFKILDKADCSSKCALCIEEGDEESVLDGRYKCNQCEKYICGYHFENNINKCDKCIN